MSLLSDIFQQNQQIAQNPTKVIKTPLQTAYDNYINAQNNAQNNKEDEWGSAIGHSINGLAKIIASATVKNPYERAGATSNLDNFDERQDNLVRNWALQRAKQRNDYVQQAREQLGLAREDNDKNYNRELTAQQIAYQQAKDKIEQQNKDRQFDLMKDQFENQKEQQAIANKWREIEDINKREAIEQAKIQAEQNAKAQEENNILERLYKQAQINKLNRENSPEYIQQQQEQALKQEQDKQRQEQLKTYVGTAKDLFSKGLLSNEDMIAIEKNPELAESLIPAKARVPLVKIPLLWDSSRRLKIDKKAKQDFQILKDANGNMAKVYKDGRIEEL